MKNRILTYLFIGLASLVILAAAVFLVWGSTPLKPMPEALVALQDSETVSVQVGDLLEFLPNQPYDTGLVLYPGGRVDYRAYAPQALAIARAGYLVVIPRMPLSLAVLDANAPDAIIADHPEVVHWAVGGHSLGGVMAAQYIASHSDHVTGLVLWASYPAGGNDLSDLPVNVVSISASLDAFSTPEEIDASRALLPLDTTWVVIQGGNHSQFGWYGLQPGDNPATISREKQMDQVAAATIALLASLEQ